MSHVIYCNNKIDRTAFVLIRKYLKSNDTKYYFFKFHYSSKSVPQKYLFIGRNNLEQCSVLSVRVLIFISSSLFKKNQ